MSGETDVEIYASLTDLDFEFNDFWVLNLTTSEQKQKSLIKDFS